MSLDPQVPLVAVPFWKRKMIWFGAAAIIGWSIFSFSQTAKIKEEPTEKVSIKAFGADSDYEPPRAKVETAGPANRNMRPPPDTQKEEKAPNGPDVSKYLPDGAKTNNGDPAPRSMTFKMPPPRQKTSEAAIDPTTNQTKVVYKGVEFPGQKASPAMDETCVLQPGILFVELDSAIDSTYPGPIFGHLPSNVYSAVRAPNGDPVVLMEKGTTISGQYNSLVTGGGAKRLSASSVWAHTPNGVWVPLVGPMGDGVGRSGLPGNVDEHWGARFGAALGLTFTEQAMSIVQAMVQKGGNSYLQFNGGGGSGVGSLAQDILRAQASIAPTFYKNQGEIISIILTTPVSFNDSYKVGNKCHV